VDEINQPDPKYYQEAFRTLAPKRAMRILMCDLSIYRDQSYDPHREGRIFVRITDICRDMPMPAQYGLAYILVSKLLRKRVPAEPVNCIRAISRPQGPGQSERE